MDVFDCIFNRRSTRSFTRAAVDDKLIGVMLCAATNAPSAGNTQEWIFIVVKDGDVKEKLAEAALRQDFVAKAPVVIVVCMDKEKVSMHYGKRGEALYGVQDTAAATMNLMLAAEGLGLKTCWVGAFDEDRVGHVLGLPNEVRPMAIVPVGYSDETPIKPRRIQIENLTHVDAYGKKYDIAYAVQTSGGKELRFKPIGNYIEDVMSRRLKEARQSRQAKKAEPAPKKTTFADFLKRLGARAGL